MKRRQEEKERKQSKKERDLGEERRGGEQRETLSSELQGARLSSPAPLARPKLPASERNTARRGLTLCCGAKNEVPVIS